MNRTMLAVVLIVFTSLYQQASARIGETPEQCQARYGQPVEKESTANCFLFHKGDIIIAVQFYEGKADALVFKKSGVNSIGIAAELSDNEIQSLLKANGGNRKWKKDNTMSIYKQWHTEDGELIANYNINDPLLTIATKGFVARAEAKKKVKEDKKLDGF